MNNNNISSAVLFGLCVTQAFCQTPSEIHHRKEEGSSHKYSLSTTYLSFLNFGSENTNIHMYEFHLGYRVSRKDLIGIKACTWKLFEPMGIPLWDPHLMKESEWYPGKIHEFGIGLVYQRLLWKGLFASLEALPLKKTYLDGGGKKLADGFKLYTSYHLGYHIPLFKNRAYLEPQIHCNYWPIDTNGPQGFEEKERRWKNDFFLFEPNLYLGFKF